MRKHFDRKRGNNDKFRGWRKSIDNLLNAGNVNEDFQLFVTCKLPPNMESGSERDVYLHINKGKEINHTPQHQLLWL